MEKNCDNCWFHIHYPWVCEKTVVTVKGVVVQVPPEDNGKNCPDWKDRKA